MKVKVTYNATGYSFVAESRNGYAANGTLSCVFLHPDGTASHVGNGDRIENGSCATWTPNA